MKQANLQKATFTPKRWLGAGLLSGLLLTSGLYVAIAQDEPKAAAAPTATVPDAPMEWQTDVDATLAQAEKDNKLVLVRFTAGWCAPCRVMDARVWPETEVQSALADKYLIVKSDIDVEGSMVAARKYGVQAVPTLIVVDGKGEEIKRAGFMSATQLVEFLGEAAKTADESDNPGDVTS